MLNRVLNPPVRPRLELEPEDYRLVGVLAEPPQLQPQPLNMEPLNEADDEDDEGKENENDGAVVENDAAGILRNEQEEGDDDDDEK